MKEIDARKLACPTPVLLTRDTIEKEHPETIKIIVDNDAARQNVSRFLASQAYAASVLSVGNDFHVTGRRQGGTVLETGASSAPTDTASAGNDKIMVMITTDRIGFGDDTLGLRLMVNFIRTLKEMGPDLWRLVLINNGVKLTVAGSAVMEDLQALASGGVTILVCGTCLEHFGLTAMKQVGETTNMLDIVTAMQLADKVINL